MFEVLEEFWGGKPLGIKSIKELSKENQIIQYGVPPNRIDLMCSISAIDFKSAWKRKKEVKAYLNGKYSKIYYISLEDLIRNKKR